MRNTKTILILSSILILFLGGWYARNYLSHTSTEIDAYRSWWQGLDPAAVNAITVHQTDQDLSLQRTEQQQWMVNASHSADPALATNWLEKLIRPESIEIVAESVMQYERLGIATDSARLVLKAGNLQKEVVIGLATVEGRYIKLQDQDPVYLIKDLPPTLDSTAVSDWINKTILSLDKNSIQKLTWTQGRQTYSADKDDPQWQNVTSVLSSLESLSIESIVSETQTLGDPAVILTVEQTDQEPIVLNLYSTADIKAVTISTIPGTYVLSESMYNSLALTPDDVKVQ